MQQTMMTAQGRGVGPGASRLVREAGGIPAVLYGRNTDPVSISIDNRILEKIISSDTGTNTIITLELKRRGRKTENRTVMIKELQRDPVRRNIIHADFYQIDLDEKLTTNVPLVITGEEDVARLGAVLQYQLREIQVECLPTNIPENLTADVSEFEVGDSLTVGDLEAPEGVDIVNEDQEVVASVVLPRMEIEEPEEEEEELLEGEEAAEGEAGEEAPEDEGEREEPA